jgi:hypothetical protein
MKHTRFKSKWCSEDAVDAYLDSFGRDLVSWTTTARAGNRGFFVTVRYTQEFGYGMTTDQMEARPTGWVDDANQHSMIPGTSNTVPVKFEEE